MSFDYCPANFTGSPQHLCLCQHPNGHRHTNPTHACVCGYEWIEEF